jgi:hypothetical protein
LKGQGLKGESNSISQIPHQPKFKQHAKNKPKRLVSTKEGLSTEERIAVKKRFISTVTSRPTLFFSVDK